MLNQVRELLNSKSIAHTSLLEIALPEERSMFIFEVMGKQATDYWHQLSQEPAGSLRPIILGCAEYLESFMHHLSIVNDFQEETYDELASKVEQFNFENWMAMRMEILILDLEEEDEDDAEQEPKSRLEPQHKTEPEGRPYCLSSWDDSGSADESQRTYVGLISADKTWQIPLLLRYGKTGDNPESVVHAAMIQRWQTDNGAALLGLGSDFLDLQISRPPQTEKEARRIARELLAYCPKLMESGTIKDFCSALSRAPYWSFRWDGEQFPDFE